MHANMLRGVPLYNFSGERFLETLQPVQVRAVICLQFNDISMFNSALEKLEHMRKHIMHEFGTYHGMSCQEFFIGWALQMQIEHSYCIMPPISCMCY